MSIGEYLPCYSHSPEHKIDVGLDRGGRIPRAIRLLLEPRLPHPRDVREPVIYTRTEPGPQTLLWERAKRRIGTNRWTTNGNRMRELLVTVTLLSMVSSQEFEPKKRLGIPPEEDPNFWPTRGRRSYWGDSRIFGNTLRHRDVPQNPEIGYSSHSWSSEGNFLGSSGGLQDYLDTWGLSLCPRKKSISLLLPLPGFRDDENDIPTCGGRFPQNRGRGRRGGERWRSQQPLYVEEPRWIALDYNQGILGGSVGDEDPFIVARGRKRSEVMDAKGSYMGFVLSPQNADPFFVARGKREAKKSDEQLSKSGPISEFDTKAVGVSSTTDKKSGLRPRAVRSTADVFEGDDFENGVKLAPRYSHPRDKHSNLQGILDEPFFISRGKKAYYGDGAPVRIPHDVDYQDPVFDEISRLYIAENRDKKSKGQDKPPRNRRGMLDELLASDDPFYVARGKKLAPRSQYFDLTINRADESPPNANGKYSIFAKSTRTKLMQKLSDFSKDKAGGDFFGVNNEPMMKTV